MAITTNETHLIKLFDDAEDSFARALSARHVAIAESAFAYSSDMHDNSSNTLVIRRAALCFLKIVVESNINLKRRS